LKDVLGEPVFVRVRDRDSNKGIWACIHARVHDEGLNEALMEP